MSASAAAAECVSAGEGEGEGKVDEVERDIIGMSWMGEARIEAEEEGNCGQCHIGSICEGIFQETLRVIQVYPYFKLVTYQTG